MRDNIEVPRSIWLELLNTIKSVWSGSRDEKWSTDVLIDVLHRVGAAAMAGNTKMPLELKSWVRRLPSDEVLRAAHALADAAERDLTSHAGDSAARDLIAARARLEPARIALFWLLDLRDERSGTACSDAADKFESALIKTGDVIAKRSSLADVRRALGLTEKTPTPQWVRALSFEGHPSLAHVQEAFAGITPRSAALLADMDEYDYDAEALGRESVTLRVLPRRLAAKGRRQQDSAPFILAPFQDQLHLSPLSVLVSMEVSTDSIDLFVHDAKGEVQFISCGGVDVPNPDEEGRWHVHVPRSGSGPMKLSLRIASKSGAEYERQLRLSWCDDDGE